MRGERNARCASLHQVDERIVYPGEAPVHLDRVHLGLDIPDPFPALVGECGVVALLGVWIALLRYGRQDRAFHEKTIAPRYALGSGESLDEIGLDVDVKPDFSGLEQAADPDESPERE